MKIEPTDFISAKAKALLEGWYPQIEAAIEPYDVLSVEKEFTFSLLNPETKSASRTFLEAGKIDAILKDKKTGELVVLEHKTTQDAIDPASDYWGRLSMDNQLSKYIMFLRSRGENCNTVIYDVVSKPSQRPSQIPLLDQSGLKIVVDENGHRVRTKDGKKWRESADESQGYVLQTRVETPEEFYIRIKGVLGLEPTRYYAQVQVPRLDSDLLEYMSDAWALSQQIIYNKRENLWPRNPAACQAFGTCEFFTLCLGRNSVDGINYRKKTKVHTELSIEPQDLEFLTNSRMNTLRQCPRKHFLKYESPTEVCCGQSEALALGTLFHKGCEEYLKTKIK